MNKQDAAQELGVSVRTLESYVAQGRLPVRYVKGKTRPVADFEADDITRLKAQLPPAPSSSLAPSSELEQETHNAEPDASSQTKKNLSEDRETSQTDHAGAGTALARLEQTTLVKRRRDSSNSMEMAAPRLVVVEAAELAKLIQTAATASTLGPRDLTAKLLLTLDEAALLCGLSRAKLRAAIAEGQLQARRVGRGWKVRPQDLHTWLDALWHSPEFSTTTSDNSSANSKKRANRHGVTHS